MKMQVYNPNNVKIYNLSAGKTLPEWLSDRRKRTLQKHDVELRRRISLMQDFEMPLVSNCIEVTRDGQYVFATGVYKPRVRCYDVSQMSMKFERCFDSEVVKMKILSEDYTKIVFLQCDRFVEFHSQHGKYYKIRIPKYGRDFDYHPASCDLYFVGATSEIYRLNLEQGRFMNSLKTNATEVFCCQFNPEHELFTCGTYEGQVECWDPRVHNRVGVLDVAASLPPDADNIGLSSVTAIKYRDGLNFAAGTSTGQILLYDLRASKPLLVKDHNYGLPIKRIDFHDDSNNLVLSADSRVLKLWHRNTGKPFTAIEPEDTKINDLCVYPKSGLLFMANEAPKILTYYIPSLGPAPKWCSLLDNLTEELEENPEAAVYDDYKFVSRTELETLGLNHLIGTNLLRAYMHGYFMDIRLYKKAKAIADPFAYEEYRKSKIREKIEEARQNRVQLKKLPKVNKKLAEKLLEQEEQPVLKKNKPASTLLKDDRFSAMFKDTDFEVDEASEEFRLLNPLVSKVDKEREKRRRLQEETLMQYEKINLGSDDEGPAGIEDEYNDSSDDDNTWADEVRQQHKEIKIENKQKRHDKAPNFYEIKSTEELKAIASNKGYDRQHLMKQSLGDRLRQTDDNEVIHESGTATGSMQMTFKLKKSDKEINKRKAFIEHHKERKKIRRSAGQLPRKKSSFWHRR